MNLIFVDKSNNVYYHHNMQNQTISEMAKIMERGMMVIPQKIRKMANITEGSYVRVMLKDDEIILKLLIEDAPRRDKSSTITISKSKYTKKQGMELLSQAKYVWSKKDDQFLSQGREQIKKRLKNNSL